MFVAAGIARLLIKNIRPTDILTDWYETFGDRHLIGTIHDGHSCLSFGVQTIGQFVGMSTHCRCLLTKYLLKSLLTRCLLTRCLLTRCLLTRCLLTKCKSTKYMFNQMCVDQISVDQMSVDQMYVD
jgi:hypothetical protein